MMTVTLCPSRLGEREDRLRFYSQVVSAMHEGPVDDLTVDLSHVTFLQAPDVLALVNVARFWDRNTGKSTTLTGVRLHVHQYLERVDALSKCSEWLHVDGALMQSQRWDRSTESASVSELLTIPAEELPNADAVAEVDVQERLQRQQRRTLAMQRRVQEQADRTTLYDAICEPLDQLDAECRVLMRAELEAAGYHQHDRGEWRRRRV
jgi:hypothetical protein